MRWYTYLSCPVVIFATLIWPLNMACTDSQPRPFWYQVEGYKYSPTEMSETGMNFDPTGQPIDVSALDRQADEAEACLIAAYGLDLNIPEESWQLAYCGYGEPFPLPLDRTGVNIKFPDDWEYSCDRSQQLLKDRAPDDSGCEAKGLTPTEECPCRWRVNFQNGRIIVVTPSQYMFKDGFVRWITGCHNPWAVHEMARCMKPTVPKLPE